MELVTLAHVTLNRVGSASSGGTSGHKQVEKVQEVPDGTPQSLRVIVVKIATGHGESPGALKGMRIEYPHEYGRPQAVIFDVNGPNTTYSVPYATCISYPALKIGNRYFKLEEVACEA